MFQQTWARNSPIKWNLTHIAVYFRPGFETSSPAVSLWTVAPLLSICPGGCSVSDHITGSLFTTWPDGRSWERALSQPRRGANNQPFVSGGVGPRAHTHTQLEADSRSASSAAMKCVVLSNSQSDRCCNSSVQTKHGLFSVLLRSPARGLIFLRLWGFSVKETIRPDRLQHPCLVTQLHSRSRWGGLLLRCLLDFFRRITSQFTALIPVSPPLWKNPHVPGKQYRTWPRAMQAMYHASTVLNH